MIHFQDESLPVQRFTLFLTSIRLFTHTNCKYNIFRTNQHNAHFVLTCKTQNEKKKKDHYSNVCSSKMRKATLNDGEIIR
jgi:hypothetical protein